MGKRNLRFWIMPAALISIFVFSLSMSLTDDGLLLSFLYGILCFLSFTPFIVGGLMGVGPGLAFEDIDFEDE